MDKVDDVSGNIERFRQVQGTQGKALKWDPGVEKGNVFFRETVIVKRPQGDPGGTARKRPKTDFFIVKEENT